MTTPTDALVLYHDSCPDGFTAAWAVWRALGDAAEYRAVNYGQDPPLDRARNRRVILVDFSYPRAALDALADVAASVEIYDHHVTARDDVSGWERGRVIFDMDRSGAGIAWDEFQPAPRPWLINYVEDRDLWRWALPDSREVSEYLFSLPRTFDEWDRALGWPPMQLRMRPPQAFIEAGRALLRAKRQRVETVCKNARWITLGGHSIPVVNTAWDFSEIGEYLCNQFPEAVCGGYYFDRADKRQWGFRSRPSGYDVSAMCKQYGGGGHVTAAGFTSEIGWLP